MSWETGSARIQELIAAGELSQVSPDRDLALRMLEDATRHLTTAAGAQSTGVCRVHISWRTTRCARVRRACWKPRDSGLPAVRETPDVASLRTSDDAILRAEVSMRTTVTIDDELLARATELTGITEKSALLRGGLETLIRVESAKRLAALGGSDSHATAAPRRRDGAA
jgi:Arc/MetJ family transcription regulator